jgi:4-amino-4-deoxy-L-arabinose transferase-like glycosyltransferase
MHMLQKIISLRYAIVLISIIAVATLLRLWTLNTIPNSLNIDETAIGYNAYSILLTGKDEYGVTLPITYKSFGDWKLIGYPLITTLPVKLFGLNAFAVRLPSALAGIAQVLLIFGICKLLFKKTGIALFASLFYAISPWSIYFSRIAYEVNLATAFFLGGLYVFLHALESRRQKYFIVAGILFAITFFTYHAYIISMPLFAIALGILFWKSILKNKTLLICLIIFFVSLGIVGISVAKQSTSKLSDVSILGNQNIIYNRSDVFLSDKAPDIKIISKTLYNKYTAVAYQFVQNYLQTYSPKFLFDTGGEKLMGNLGYFGLFYFVDAFFIMLGFGRLLYLREKHLPLLFTWLLIAPIPSAITVDAPSSTRAFLVLPVLIIIGAYGAHFLYTYIKGFRLSFLLLGIISIIFAWNILLFLDGYFVHMNYRRAIFQHYGYEQAVALANEYPKDKVIMQGPDNFPYISFLFFNRYYPEKFRKGVSYYPDTGSGFVMVNQFDRFSFVKSIDYSHIAANTLYIDLTTQVPDRKIYSVVGTINLPNGNPVMAYFIK